MSQKLARLKCPDDLWAKIEQLGHGLMGPQVAEYLKLPEGITAGQVEEDSDGQRFVLLEGDGLPFWCGPATGQPPVWITLDDIPVASPGRRALVRVSGELMAQAFLLPQGVNVVGFSVVGPDLHLHLSGPGLPDYCEGTTVPLSARYSRGPEGVAFDGWVR